MSRRLVIRPEAVDEIDEAAAWYELRRRGLARDFIDAVDAGIRSVHEHPFRHPVVFDRARHRVLAVFPYSIIFFITNDEVVILSCFHDRRNPIEWQSRL